MNPLAPTTRILGADDERAVGWARAFHEATEPFARGVYVNFLSEEGEGRVVLVHVTANAEWSSLPLSGLFVQMLERLSVSTRLSGLSADDLAGTVWTPDQVLSAFGEVEDAGTLPGVAG